MFKLMNCFSVNNIENNITKENIFDDENCSSNITNTDNVIKLKRNLKNNYDEYNMLKISDMKNNNDIDDEESNNELKDITFNDTLDMNHFCNKRSYFSHSTCICDTLLNTGKVINRSNMYSKTNNNNNILCDMYALNETYSINKTPIIFDQTIDQIYDVTIENSIDCNIKNNINKNKNSNENNGSEKNFQNNFNIIMNDTDKSKIVI